jgi:hypothetical protein
VSNGLGADELTERMFVSANVTRAYGAPWRRESRRRSPLDYPPHMGTSFLSAGERRFKSLKLTADRISHDFIEEELQGRSSGLILSKPGHHGAGDPGAAPVCSAQHGNLLSLCR